MCRRPQIARAAGRKKGIYMKTTLLVMAAGIGSRFGKGIKQLATVDGSGHIIMDYSVHDAIAAGFNKIIFVIRRDIEQEFRAVIGSRIEPVCQALGVEVGYGFQSLTDIPAEVPQGRQKPWGTGQAVLCARQLLQEPFAVINADDYYGKEAFVKIHDFLISGGAENGFCMAGLVPKNTLSDNGAVTRGICRVSDTGYLTHVEEVRGIQRTPQGAASGDRQLDADTTVSMNMWGLTPAFLDMLEAGFQAFFSAEAAEDPLKAEFLLPTFIGQLLAQEKVTVKVLSTQDKWFGVTYQEDRASVVDSIQSLIRAGAYSRELYSDLHT